VHEALRQYLAAHLGDKHIQFRHPGLIPRVHPVF